MKTDENQLLMIFDELIEPRSNEVKGLYSFRKTRKDGLQVILSFSTNDQTANVLVRDCSESNLTCLSMQNCAEIRVLDDKKKCLEIVHEDKAKSRCFLSLLGDSIVSYEE